MFVSPPSLSPLPPFLPPLRSLSVSTLYGGPAHIKIVAEWEPETKAGIFGVVPDEVPEMHASAKELNDFYRQPLEASLQDCLQMYTREEIVSATPAKSVCRLS